MSEDWPRLSEDRAESSLTRVRSSRSSRATKRRSRGYSANQPPRMRRQSPVQEKSRSMPRDITAPRAELCRDVEQHRPGVCCSRPPCNRDRGRVLVITSTRTVDRARAHVARERSRFSSSGVTVHPPCQVRNRRRSLTCLLAAGSECRRPCSKCDRGRLTHKKSRLACTGPCHLACTGP